MKKVVVIGNGMVGFRFCQKLREKAAQAAFEIVVFGEEALPAYDRVHLSEFFSNQSADGLLLADKEWYQEKAIDLRVGEYVNSIDRENKRVFTISGQTESYDILVIASGSSAMVPPIQGVDKRGVFVYRTVEDLQNIISYGANAKKAAVLGGGLLALEAAKALLDMALETHVVEFAPRLMPKQLDDAGAQLLREKIEALGIAVHLNKRTTVLQGEDRLEGLEFSSGEVLKADMLVISCGIVPRDELAKQAGLEVGRKGGIVVNDQLQSSDPDIYAIGEVALHEGMIYGLVAPGYNMAGIAADQLVGYTNKSFAGNDMSTKLKLLGVDVASFGDALGSNAASRPIIFENKGKGFYKRINVSEDGKRLTGGILVGDVSDYTMLHQVMHSGLVMPAEPEDLILGSRSGESQANSMSVLPDVAQVCSCENVTKGDIISAVKEHKFENVDQVKVCTKAGTGCGACSPIVADIFNETLKATGKAIRNVLCEHFQYSRQELFDLIKVNNIRGFDDLLDQFGSGHGCETCKPAVASMFASIWNDLILKQDTIQDTNDRFLANIQKGGSYSVVPRVPGGEITAEKLIVIGEVAKKYALYVKITGGQRIDLLGARIDELPLIWEELIAAGFESGHAYGKSLRTVKSCVGSAWCRFGLHDSVSFAIEVENRYKGLRAPHKLKGGVSGCRRECAEAQSKDFGIIATEKGWNLYVGGNGGANPQHAQLLVTDVDSVNCLKYLDRFLMFYIKTAEPLNRTATWLNKMEGGIAYLKDVVVHDSLGIGEQLQHEMDQLVNTYHCEWKEAVNNEELRAKFKHFVNSDQADPHQKFAKMRGQKVPAE